MGKKPERYQNRIELLQGTLDMLVLQTLRWGAQHGYGIGQAIRAGSGDVLQVETGSLYPAAPAGAAGLGEIGMEAIGEQAAGEVLQPDGGGTEAPGGRARPVE
jgi:hypothetical protein